jgi:hypothetical protein
MITISLSHQALQSAVFKAFSANLTHEYGVVEPVVYKETFGWRLVSKPQPDILYNPVEPWNDFHNPTYWFDRSILCSADPNDYVSPLREQWGVAKSLFVKHVGVSNITS